MNFSFITEKDEIVKQYLNETILRVSTNSTLNMYVNFNYTYKDSKKSTTYNITWETLFPNKMFKYPIYLYLIICLVVFVFTNSLSMLYGLILIVPLFTIPLLLQTKQVIYFLIKRQLKKKGYNGLIKCL